MMRGGDEALRKHDPHVYHGAPATALTQAAIKNPTRAWGRATTVCGGVEGMPAGMQGQYQHRIFTAHHVHHFAVPRLLVHTHISHFSAPRVPFHTASTHLPSPPIAPPSPLSARSIRCLPCLISASYSPPTPRFRSRLSPLSFLPFPSLPPSLPPSCGKRAMHT